MSRWEQWYAQVLWPDTLGTSGSACHHSERHSCCELSLSWIRMSCAAIRPPDNRSTWRMILGRATNKPPPSVTARDAFGDRQLSTAPHLDVRFEVARSTSQFPTECCHQPPWPDRRALHRNVNLRCLDRCTPSSTVGGCLPRRCAGVHIYIHSEDSKPVPSHIRHSPTSPVGAHPAYKAGYCPVGAPGPLNP